MSDFFAFNSQSKINLNTGQSEYAFPGKEGVVAYVVQSGKTLKVITSYGDVGVQGYAKGESVIGARVDIVWQSGMSDRHQYGVPVVGYVNDKGEQFGTVPAKAVQHFVMK